MRPDCFVQTGTQGWHFSPCNLLTIQHFNSERTHHAGEHCTPVTSVLLSNPGHRRFPLYRFPPSVCSVSPMWLLMPVLVTLLVIICLLMILTILMQRPKSEGLGAAFGGGLTDNLFGAQTTTVLTKFTVWLGGLFFALTLLISVLQVKVTAGPTAIQKQLMKAPSPASSPVTPSAPAK
ncbi:preprotein translocase subunit SecG [bacterium]|nr:preprotein translocase subunit SecG [bacterium]